MPKNVPSNYLCRISYGHANYNHEARGSAVVRTLAYHAARPDSIPGLRGEIIRCKNLALYIRDCEYLCLSDDTLKAVGPLELSGVYARGSKISHTG